MDAGRCPTDHARTHPAQDWPDGPVVDRCRDCGATEG